MHLTGEDPYRLEFIYFSAGGNKEKEAETDGSERVCEIVNPPIKKATGVQNVSWKSTSVGLTCSLGSQLNRLLGKLGSDLN